MTTLEHCPPPALPHPRKILVPLEQARAWAPDDFLIQRKFDGALECVHVAGADILCERMRPKSGGFFNADDRRRFDQFPAGWRAALTVASVHGENMLGRSTRERWGVLCSFVNEFPPDLVLAGPASIPEKLPGDEEGFVAHAWEAPWGEMLAVKQGGIWLCRVTDTGGSQSVEIEIVESGNPRSRVKLGGGKCDQVRVGSLIRVEGMGLTEAGKIREPRPCREWLVQY